MRYSLVKQQSARYRYTWEYKQDRMFNSYLDCKPDFDGDKAFQNGYKSWQMKHSEFSGWVNSERGLRWFDLMCDRYPEHIFPF